MAATSKLWQLKKKKNDNVFYIGEFIELPQENTHNDH